MAQVVGSTSRTSVDDEVFEISDFTVVTEWERFIVSLESVLHDWQLVNKRRYGPLHKGQLMDVEWELHSITITTEDNRVFTVEHHKALLNDDLIKEESTGATTSDYLPAITKDILAVGNDFPPTAHRLVRWFGVREFLVLIPQTKKDVVIGEDFRNLILSSFSMALQNCNCDVPFFLQTHHLNRQIYYGVCENKNVRTTFTTVQLKNVAPKYNNLAGLSTIFKEKLSCPTGSSGATVKVSVRVTFNLVQDEFDRMWTQSPPDLDTPLSESLGFLGFQNLPFGACQDPLKDLSLAVQWINMNEDMLVENEVYSDLDPLGAPFWFLRAVFHEKLSCLLTDNARAFLKLKSVDRNSGSILGFRYGDSYAVEALSRLTDPAMPVKLRSHSDLQTSANVHSSVIDEKTLKMLMVFLFPDINQLPKARESESSEEGHVTDETELLSKVSPPGSLVKSFSSPMIVDETTTGTQLDQRTKFKKLLGQVKSAPKDSLLWRLALVLANLNSSMQGVDAVAYLWHNFVEELRCRWHGGNMIPLLDGGSPDLGSTLLHQKLQMLNCCIKHRRSRENNEPITVVKVNRSSIGSAEETPSEHESDEFYDCFEDRSILDMDRKPEGRLKPLENLQLLQHPDHPPLYIPVTQDPSPMTEDMCKEHAEVLTQLGTSAEAALLRAKMQSASLLSDMESFKAANPGCGLEDFVRWYSPRDYLEPESSEDFGRLSERMLIPGNTWIETWDSALPRPASKQKRLFNETVEAEKILHWLSLMTLSEICELMMPVYLTAVVDHAFNEAVTANCDAELLVESAAKTLLFVARSFEESDSYEEVLKQVEMAERHVAQFQCLRSKFTVTERNPLAVDTHPMSEAEWRDFSLTLMNSYEVNVLGGASGAIGHVIREIFSTDTRVIKAGKPGEFPPPFAKEYILRCSCPRPAIYSRNCPHRMFATFDEGTFRLAYAFSEDTTFF